MKYLILLLLSLSAVLVSAEINKAEFLSAIAQVETGNRNNLIGVAGERSAYQFMPLIWRYHSELPFEEASVNRIEADKVAIRHLNYLIDKLRRMSKDVTVENLALCWNAGETKVRRNTLEPRHYKYAEKVVKIYQSNK